MNSSERRKKLHTYIADIDYKKVLIILTLPENEVKYETKPVYTEKEKEEIRRREKNRLSGKSKTCTLTEAKALLTTKALH